MKERINLLGSIAKKETLIPIQTNILEQTFVAEAAYPYINYYGQLPSKPKPNSLFLFTTKFYFLEEILSSAQLVKKCLLEKINIASAVIEYKNKQYPAIRVKNFPDYKELCSLQLCLAEHGIEFAKKIHIEGLVNTRVNKPFVLEELEANFFMDTQEENKGYFLHGNRNSAEDFQTIMKNVKNNGDCKLFDAVQGKILSDGKVLEFVRIFAEGLDLQLLKCIRKEFLKLTT